MGKEKKEKRANAGNGQRIVARCLTRHIHCAPRKVRIVVDMIRDKSVGEALEILKFTHRPSAVPYIERAIKSAAQNASEIHPDPQTLVIGEIYVNGDTMMKRIRPASMGRAVRVRKRMSHLFVALTEN